MDDGHVYDSDEVASKNDNNEHYSIMPSQVFWIPWSDSLWECFNKFHYEGLTRQVVINLLADQQQSWLYHTVFCERIITTTSEWARLCSVICLSYWCVVIDWDLNMEYCWKYKCPCLWSGTSRSESRTSSITVRNTQKWWRCQNGWNLMCRKLANLYKRWGDSRGAWWFLSWFVSALYRLNDNDDLNDNVVGACKWWLGRV